jgi:hypothetical protein
MDSHNMICDALEIGIDLSRDVWSKALSGYMLLLPWGMECILA